MDNVTFVILGLGIRTTLFYLKELNRLYKEKKGGHSTCPLILYNVDFNKINTLLPNPSEQLDGILQSNINDIKKFDVTHILVPNITLHETIDRLVIHKKILHPVSLSVSKIKQNKWTEIVLFGSLYSMQSSYISSYFELNGIDVILPTEEDMLLIDEIRKQIYNETETEELIKTYHLLIEKYTKKYTVVLACTELSILKPKCDNLVDMAQIQIEEAISCVV